MKGDTGYVFNWADRHTREKVAGLAYYANKAMACTEAQIYPKSGTKDHSITVQVSLAFDVLSAELPESLGSQRIEWDYPNILAQIEDAER